jgi:tetratricopeptide (TPR) repeat protein
LSRREGTLSKGFEEKVEDLLQELESEDARLHERRIGSILRGGRARPDAPGDGSGGTADPSFSMLYNSIRDRIGKPYELTLLIAMGKVSDSLGDWRRALGWFRTGLALSEEIRDLRSKAEILHRIGILRLKEGRWEEALQCFDLCREIGERKVHDERYSAMAELGAGMVHTRRGRSDRADECFTRALAIAEKLDDRAMIAEIHENQGILLVRRGEYDEAMTLFVNNLARFERSRDIRGMARVFYDLGDVYRRMNEVEKAVEYLERSMEAALELGDRHLVAKNYLAKGELYLSSRDLTLALAYSEKAIRAFSRIGDELGIVACLKSIGSILAKQGRTALARKYLDRGRRLARDCGDGESEVEIDRVHRRLKEDDIGKHSIGNG